MNNSDNPWLSIPAADYEAHMASPEVGQLQFLNAVFKETLARQRPKSLLVPGCATGNGFEHIDFTVTRRIVAVDINPATRLPHSRFFGPVLKATASSSRCCNSRMSGYLRLRRPDFPVCRSSRQS
jgi:hypothetical protein